MTRAQGNSWRSIRNVWHEHGLQPHRTTRFKLWTDRQFVTKLGDAVGLYLAPPAKAVVFCVDEKSGIQTLDRTQPALPLRPGPPERQAHDYRRHGTTCLLAALRLFDELVLGDFRPKRDTAGFVQFPDRIDQVTDAGKLDLGRNLGSIRLVMRRLIGNAARPTSPHGRLDPWGFSASGAHSRPA